MSPSTIGVNLSLKQKVEIIEESKQPGLSLNEAAQNYGIGVLRISKLLKEPANETMIVKLLKKR